MHDAHCILFPPPFTGEGDRGEAAVEGACAQSMSPMMTHSKK
jgi:hypothetical protein